MLLAKSEIQDTESHPILDEDERSATPCSTESNIPNEDLLHEMHKQLKAASRIISNLKTRVEELDAQTRSFKLIEADLHTKIQSLEKEIKGKVELCEQKELYIRNELHKRKPETAQMEVSDKDSKSSMGQETLESCLAEANKKLKLAQDQMARIIAKDRRELQDWVLKCQVLERNESRAKVMNDLRLINAS